ncbi:hypothetical protein AB0N14_34555 [Streptomyces sp. NPDC051104]|uniref:hypothetical protein n=1 Tax=Streptomyces sp. NPDC051104 TaxID=3155044 RepID=UPI00342D39C9
MVGLPSCGCGRVGPSAAADGAEKAGTALLRAAAPARRQTVTVRREIGAFILHFLGWWQEFVPGRADARVSGAGQGESDG